LEHISTRFCIVADLSALSDSFLWTVLVSLSDSGFDVGKQRYLRRELRYRAMKLLLRHIDGRLGRYISSIEQDLAILRVGGIAKQERLAVKQRLYEKRQLSKLRIELSNWIRSALLQHEHEL
jgi:hypothetical protein